MRSKAIWTPTLYLRKFGQPEQVLDLGTIPDRFAGHGGGDALMMNYVCELIAAGGAEGLTGGRLGGKPRDGAGGRALPAHTAAPQWSWPSLPKNNALFRPCSRAAGTGAAGRPGGKPFTAKGRAGLCTTNKEAAMEAF